MLTNELFNVFQTILYTSFFKYSCASYCTYPC